MFLYIPGESFQPSEAPQRRDKLVISGMLSDLVNPVGHGFAAVLGPKALSTGNSWETEGKPPCEV